MEVINVFENGRIIHSIQKPESIQVRKATTKDVNAIYKVACSVGSKTKESYEGFLVDDYRSNPKYFQKFFLEKTFELDHFYVAKNHGEIVGFLMAYTKDQWLKYNPNWIEDVMWRPDFNIDKTNNFVVVDKTAILSNMTGMGIGSNLYKRLIKDLKARSIDNIFAETIVSPTPNFASLSFRKKQNYTLAGVRYENYNNTLYTDLIYYKTVE